MGKLELTSARIQTALSQYFETERNARFDSDLALSDWYDLFPELGSGLVTPYRWPQNFPNAGKPGVYFVFENQQLLRYVGMSETNVQSRLGRYFGGGQGPCIVKPITPQWKATPRFVRTMAVADSREVPLIEGFLIHFLQPPDNTRGILR